MGVAYNDFLGGYTPTCNECGIALCWDISPEEYEDRTEFWDEWRCKECDPKAIGSRKRYISAGFPGHVVSLDEYNGD
jgi:hypothetical protein